MIATGRSGGGAGPDHAEQDKTNGNAGRDAGAADGPADMAALTGRDLAARIEALRLERGWSQQQLSERAGLGKAAVNDLVNHPARRTRPATIRKLAQALGVSPDFLTAGGVGVAGDGGPVDLESEMTGGRGLAALLAEADRFALHRLDPSGMMGGAARAEYVIIDRLAAQNSGDLVLVTAGGMVGLRYLAEPYLIGVSGESGITHALRGGDGGEVMGRVLCRISIF